jgi:hypothetical protein
MGEEIFFRSSIRGRGTVCWPVKDYWMSEGRVPEFEFLEKAKGFPGVCQIVSYEEGRGETKDFRGTVVAIRGRLVS